MANDILMGMNWRRMDIGWKGIGLWLLINSSVGMGRMGNQSCCSSAASCLRKEISYLGLVQHLASSRDNACAGVGCVARLLCVVSGGQCWLSPGPLARMRWGGLTPVGACPPSAGTDADAEPSPRTPLASSRAPVHSSPFNPLPSAYLFLSHDSFPSLDFSTST